METYISQQKNQLLDSLENQVRFSQLVAVVVGAKGIGKSFLIEELHRRLENDVLHAKIDAGLAMSEDQLEKTISLQLGLNWQNSEVDLQRRIQNELTTKVLITIDDAHLLSNSCLDFILQLNQNQLQLQESILFILLAGDPDLPGLIKQTAIFSQHLEMCVVFQIEPILQNETKTMVAEFGHLSDPQLDKLYDAKKLDYFWQLSKGNPAELFYHLSRWIEENSPTEIVKVKTSEKTTYLKGMLYGSIVIVLIITLFFQQQINQWITQKETSVGPNNTHQPKEVIRLAVDKETDPQKQTKKSSDEKMEDNKAAAKNKIKLIKKFPENLSQSLINDVEITSQNVVPQDQKTSSPDEPVSQPKKQTINLIELSKDEKFLLNQSSKLVVLQWMGVSQYQTALTYKKEHPLSRRIRIYRRQNGKQPIYLVISDQFLDHAQASAAIVEYKKRKYQGTPWIKKMSAVQKEIKAFRDSGIR